MQIVYAEPYRYLHHSLNFVTLPNNTLKTILYLKKSFLPFLTFGSRDAKYLSYLVCGWNIVCLTSSSQLFTWRGARNVLEFACTFFEFGAAIFLHNALNVAEIACTLKDDFLQSKWKRIINKSLQAVNNLFFLATFIRPQSTKIPIMALYFQASTYFIQAALKTYTAFTKDRNSQLHVQQLYHQQDLVNTAEHTLADLDKIKKPNRLLYKRLWDNQHLVSQQRPQVEANRSLLFKLNTKLAWRAVDIGITIILGIIRLFQVRSAIDPMANMGRDKPFVVMRAQGERPFIVMHEVQDEPRYVIDSRGDIHVPDPEKPLNLVSQTIQSLAAQEGATSIQFVSNTQKAAKPIAAIRQKLPGTSDARFHVNPQLDMDHEDHNRQLLKSLKKTDRPAYKQYKYLSDKAKFDAIPIEGFESYRETFNRFHTLICDTLAKADPKALTVFVLPQNGLYNWLRGLAYTASEG
jgi:hypothetical protein